jgi:hypothetical protein
MKRWIISVLLAIFLSYPAVSGAVLDDYDSGKATIFSFPLFKIPIGSKPDSNAADGKKEAGDAKNDATKEKEKQDRKVDDALKKAWGE